VLLSAAAYQFWGCHDLSITPPSLCMRSSTVRPSYRSILGRSSTATTFLRHFYTSLTTDEQPIPSLDCTIGPEEHPPSHPLSHTSNTSTMGWFGGSSAQPTPPPPAPSTDGGFIAPDRTARAQCWDGRDSFFKCLDRHSIIDSVREDEKARKVCAPELKEFESACASSWVRTVGCI